MSKKTMSAADLLNQAKGGGDPAKEKATFIADTLHCIITDERGNTVIETTLTPRGFTAKKDNRTGLVRGGLGWYGDVRGDDVGFYEDHAGVKMAVSAGLRVSLDGIKVSPDAEVDLTGGNSEE